MLRTLSCIALALGLAVASVGTAAAHRGLMEEQVARAGNGHCKLDASEREAMRTARLEERFKSLDANQDGVISKDEFIASARPGMFGHGHGHGRDHGRGQGQSFHTFNGSK